MKTIQDGLSANDAMNQAVEKIKISGKQMAEAVQQLMVTTETVGQVGRDLSEISLQTKILAINAGVEAAHVGAQGATFAVVAEQIKEIAERCKKASERTQDTIKNSLSISKAAAEAGRRIDADIQSIVYQQYEISEVLNGFAAQKTTEGGSASNGESSANSVDDTNKVVFDVATMSTGVYDVDQQHRNLIDMINQLDAAVRQGREKEGVDRLLNFLGDYVLKHFSFEEKIMEERQCPMAEKNREAHAKLVETYTEWRKKYEEQGADLKMVVDLRDLLKQWLVGHICNIDCSLRKAA